MVRFSLMERRARSAGFRFLAFRGRGGCVRADARCSEEIFRRPRECACNQHEVMYVAFIQTLDVWMNYLKKE
ncbi:MAG TPA: hypothetical protein DD422_00685 [Akkermansia sp.]|nr:hypothetical protein [Akkermansia sp.]